MAGWMVFHAGVCAFLSFMITRAMGAGKGANHRNCHQVRHAVPVTKDGYETVLRCGMAGRFRLSLFQRRGKRFPEAVSLSFLSTMANLSGYLLIDASTGTVLSASTCYLVADDAFTVEDWDIMESFSDAEMCDFAKQRGEKLSDVVRLRPILPGEH